MLWELAGCQPLLYQKNWEHLRKQQENSPLEKSCALVCVELLLLQPGALTSFVVLLLEWTCETLLPVSKGQSEDSILLILSPVLALYLHFRPAVHPKDAFLTALPVCCQIPSFWGRTNWKNLGVFFSADLVPGFCSGTAAAAACSCHPAVAPAAVLWG